MTITTPVATPCRFCGNYHGVLCPAVKAYDLHPDGTLKRVEFRDASPMGGMTVDVLPPTRPAGHR